MKKVLLGRQQPATRKGAVIRLPQHGMAEHCWLYLKPCASV
jgi:hypothetical protein